MTPPSLVSTGPPVAPSVFDGAARYSEALQNGTISIDKPLSDTTPIINFCQSFFVQFFDNVLHEPLMAIDAQAKEQAARVREALPSDGSAAPIRLLVSLFEELCDEWPEVLGLSYGFLRSDLLEFHRDYLPSLFEAITAWTKGLGDQVLLQRANDAEAAYGKGLAALNARVRKP
jgi:hypothetical protein